MCSLCVRSEKVLYWCHSPIIWGSFLSNTGFPPIPVILATLILISVFAIQQGSCSPLGLQVLCWGVENTPRREMLSTHGSPFAGLLSPNIASIHCLHSSKTLLSCVFQFYSSLQLEDNSTISYTARTRKSFSLKVTLTYFLSFKGNCPFYSLVKMCHVYISYLAYPVYLI